MGISMSKKPEVKTTLTSAELVEEGGQYYISAKYTVENEHNIREFIIPRIEIPFVDNPKRGFDISREFNLDRFENPFCLASLCDEDVYFNTGPKKLRLRRGKVDGVDHDVYYIEKIIEEKKVDLTIEEIEKKLGYKIRIVGEKNGKI